MISRFGCAALVMVLEMVVMVASAFAASPVTTVTYSYGGASYTTASQVCNAMVRDNPPSTSGSVDASGICRFTDSSGNSSGQAFNTNQLKISKTVCADGTAPNLDLPLPSQCPDPPPTCKIGELRVQKFSMTSGGGMPTHDLSCNLTVTQLLVCRLEVVAGGKRPPSTVCT